MCAGGWGWGCIRMNALAVHYTTNVTPPSPSFAHPLLLPRSAAPTTLSYTPSLLHPGTPDATLNVLAAKSWNASSSPLFCFADVW